MSGKITKNMNKIVFLVFFLLSHVLFVYRQILNSLQEVNENKR